jgi:hypothetical protein
MPENLIAQKQKMGATPTSQRRLAPSPTAAKITKKTPITGFLGNQNSKPSDKPDRAWTSGGRALREAMPRRLQSGRSNQTQTRALPSAGGRKHLSRLNIQISPPSRNKHRRFWSTTSLPARPPPPDRDFFPPHAHLFG